MRKKKVLYLGLIAPEESCDRSIIHYPVIETVPIPASDPKIQQALGEIDNYTHLIFTSKMGVHFFSALAPLPLFQHKTLIAVGQSTAASLKKIGATAAHIAELEQAEGVIAILEKLDLKGAYLFWPRSSRARPIIANFLQQRNLKFRDTAFYETLLKKPLPCPDLREIDEIIFTSPSTVEGFIAIFGKLPKDKTLTAIGSVTQEALIDAQGTVRQ